MELSKATCPKPITEPIVFFRGGALGDFLLTLPLLTAAREYGTHVKLYARSKYFCLLGQNWDWLEKCDIDEGSDLFSNLPKSSQVITFWRDLDWQKQAKTAGASRTFALNSRPENGQHFFEQAMEDLGWSMTNGWESNCYLGDCWRGGDQTLWIHPGSGGEFKNLPFAYYQEIAMKWIESRKDRKVIFSFGEADNKLLENFNESEWEKSSRVEMLRAVGLQRFRNEMVLRADKFMGNDSGPGHLAANLGIPVEIAFRGTNQSVWKPTGSRVTTHYCDSDSKRIL